MAVTLTVRQIDELAAIVVAESDREPPVQFSLYQDGEATERLTSAAAQFWRLIHAPPGEQIYVDVTDLPAAKPLPAFSPRALLNWQEAAFAHSYVVDKHDGLDWAEQARLAADGEPAMTWRTPRLADGETHRFRVAAADRFGARGDPLEFVFRMARIPDAPAVDYSLDPDTGYLTVSEAG